MKTWLKPWSPGGRPSSFFQRIRRGARWGIGSQFRSIRKRENGSESRPHCSMERSRVTDAREFRTTLACRRDTKLRQACAGHRQNRPQVRGHRIDHINVFRLLYINGKDNDQLTHDADCQVSEADGRKDAFESIARARHQGEQLEYASHEQSDDWKHQPRHRHASQFYPREVFRLEQFFRLFLHLVNSVSWRVHPGHHLDLHVSLFADYVFVAIAVGQDEMDRRP